MADILKFIHCGCEYNFCSTKAPPFPEDIFGDGSDGDCHITCNSETRGHITIPAQEYNFCNLTIDEGVTLHFCGNGIPIIKVKENFVNCGTIQLRNPLLCANYEEYIQGLGKIIHNKCNYCYELACAYYNCECFTLACLSSARACGGTSDHQICEGGYGGGAGESGGQGGGPGGNGGTTAYSNAGGGGGSGKNFCNNVFNNGCNAPGDGIGGDGGCGYYYSHCSSCRGTGSGGGGGYGYYKGGKGGDSCGVCCSGGGYGGNGGNSYVGDGGDGGYSCSTIANISSAFGGKGGDTYYGNGGNGGNSTCDRPGSGGNTIYGNGGDSGSSYNFYCTNCNRTILGGNSIYGNGGCGVIGGNGLDGGNTISTNACGEGGIAWGGTYGLGLFAYNIDNQGTIFGRGGDGGAAWTASKRGTDGAEIYIIIGCDYCNSGEISCRAGKGGRSTQVSCPDGQPGFVELLHN